MLYFTLLCLAGSVLAQPTVYLTGSGLEYPWSFYNPPVIVADVAAKVPGIPEAPLLEPLSLVRTISLEDPADRKVDVIVEEKKEEETDGKPEEEIKEEEPKEETEKSEDMKEEKIEKIVIAPGMPGEPIIVAQLDPSHKITASRWANNFWSNLPISLPHINFPFTFPPIFGKPPPSLPTPSEPAPVVETLRYLDPSLINSPYVRVVSAI